MKKPMLYTALSLAVMGGVLLNTTDAAAERDKKMKGHGKHFERMDTNQDGVITLDEMVKGAKKRFEHMDSDGDGKITKKEMRKKFGKHKSEKGDRRDKEERD